MAKLTIPSGTTSKRIAIFVQDSSSTTGAGLTGLAFGTSGLTCYSWIDTDGNAGGTAQALQTATLGTWTTRGFIQKDSTNLPGFYEFGVPDALLAAGVKWAIVMFKGATNMAPLVLEIEVTAVSNQDAVRGGMTALPNANAEAAGGLYTRGSGAGQINQPANGLIDVNTLRWNGTAVSAPATAGIPDVNVKNINNVAAATPGAAGGLFIAGTNAATTITSGSGSALTLSSTGSGGHGLNISGNGGGHGINTTGGATGHGISAAGGATSGDGIQAFATTSGRGISAFGAGTTKAGIYAEGGATTSAGMELKGGSVSGDGLKVTTISGHGINIAPAGSSMHGILSTGGNAGTSDGVKCVAGTGGVDVRANLTGNITGNLSGSAGSVTGAVGSVTGAVGSVTGAVGSLTTNNDKTGYALTAGERMAVADALLDRDMSVGTDSGSPTVRTPRQALRFLRNKWTIAAGTLTVRKEDDATSSWTGAVTTTAGNPVSQIDPP